jgi:flagellar protein FlgJ
MTNPLLLRSLGGLGGTGAASLPAATSLSGGASFEQLATDLRGVQALRSRAASDPRASAREAARQFESLFMQELLKGMRASVPAGDLDNQGSKLGTEMLDQQFAGKLSGLKGGLSEVILRQLERQMGLTPGPIPSTASANDTPAPLAAKPEPTRIPQAGAAGFVQQHTAAARKAESETGIPAAFMISQSALETGWGRKEIKHADGTPSFNLFGIKAGPNWKGPVAEITTTEYIDGRAIKVTAKFRAYASYEESFADYARLMKNSPRYAQVLAQADSAKGFAQGLQKAGYATDPAYADKLGKVINTTLRLQRLMA